MVPESRFPMSVTARARMTVVLPGLLREVRGNQPPLSDVEATQKRHRRIQRIQQAMVVARNVLGRRG